jgi:hypothetical protein
MGCSYLHLQCEVQNGPMCEQKLLMGRETNVATTYYTVQTVFTVHTKRRNMIRIRAANTRKQFEKANRSHQVKHRLEDSNINKNSISLHCQLSHQLFQTVVCHPAPFNAICSVVYSFVPRLISCKTQSKVVVIVAWMWADIVARSRKQRSSQLGQMMFYRRRLAAFVFNFAVLDDFSFVFTGVGIG